MYRARPYTPKDLHPLMILNQQCFSMPWSVQAVRFDAEENTYSHWAVLEEAAPAQEKAPWQSWLRRLIGSEPAPHLIGFGAFWVMHGEAHITSLGIAPTYRGHGLGEVILSSILQRAATAGGRYSTLEVRVSNQPAQRLYSKYSYRVVGRKPSYYHDNGEDALVMRTRPFDTPEYQNLLRWRVAQLHHRTQWVDDFANKSGS